MTGQPTPSALRLDQIALDDRAWPRDALDEERIELFAEMIHDAREASGGDPLPALVVVADGCGGYLLADGRHRYEALRRLGLQGARVQLFTADGRAPEHLAYELALRYATVSAKPLTTAEKRGAIDRLIDERPELSNRQIARLVGVSHSTVNEHRRRVDGSSTPAGASRDQPSRWQPLSWEVAARRLAKDVAELLASCRKLFGGTDFKAAGRELYDALADLYGDEGALAVIDELSAVVSNARARAGKAAS